MSTPMAEAEIAVTVCVLVPTQLENDSGRPLKRKFDDAKDVKFVLFCKPHEDLGVVWDRAEKVFNRAYSRNITSSGYFSRMKVKDVDVFRFYRVGQFFQAGRDDNVLVVVQDPMDRNDSIPPDSILRPENFQRPTPPAAPDSRAAKRRKVHGGEHAMTVDEISPEMPIESNEQAAERAQRHHENQATEPRVDADGYRIPPIPNKRPILPAKSRRTAQTTAPTTTQATVLVQDSQPNTAAPKPQSASEALWLRKQAATGRQQSMPINNSSPAEAAATRAKTTVPQPLQLNQTANTSSTFAEEAGIESSAGETRQTLPTPTSAGQRSAEQQAPTSAQPPPSSNPPFSNMAHRYIRRTSTSDGTANDPIIDDDGFYVNDIDDNNLGEVDDDYVPDEPVKPRGRTRSRSLETIPARRNASDGLEHSSSQLPEGTSTTLMGYRTAEDLPTSTSAFDEMRSSQAARSSSCRGTSSAAKWSKKEDIALLKGMKTNMTVPAMKKKFNIDRSESALRNRRVMLLKMFPEGKVPSNHEFYAEVEGNASLVAATPAARASAAISTATLTVTSRSRHQWSPDQTRILWDAVAHGFDTKEIRQKHFPNRSEESVIKKVKDIFERVVAREKKRGTIPDDSVPVAGWADQDSLTMRRAMDEGLTAYEAWQTCLGDFSIHSIRMKYAAYEAQLKKAKTTDARQNGGSQNDADQNNSAQDDAGRNDAAQNNAAQDNAGQHNAEHSTDEEETNLFEIARQTQEAQQPSVPMQHEEAQGRMQLRNHQPTSADTPNQPAVPRRSQPRESPQVVITPRDSRRNSASESTQLKKTQGNGGQSQLNFKRDKQKRAIGPSGAALRAQIDRAYSRASSRTEAQPSTVAQPAEAEPAAAFLDVTNDVETMDLCNDDSDGDYVDVDDIVPDDNEPMSENQKKLLREIDSQTDDEEDELYANSLDESKSRMEVVSEQNSSAPVFAEENSPVSPMPAVAEEDDPVPIVTEPYDLRTWLTEPDSKGRVMIGRPEFPTSFHKDIIETDQQIWDKAMKLHKNRKGLAKTQFEIDRLGFQSYIAMSAQDWNEKTRLEKKIKPLQRFLKLKERGTVPANTNFADWVPDRNERAGSVDEEFDRDDEDGEAIESDEGDEDNEGGYGAQLPDEEEYPHGVERDREIVEVEDEEDGEAPANPLRVIRGSSPTVYISADEENKVVSPKQKNNQEKKEKKYRKRKPKEPAPTVDEAEKKPKKKRKRSKGEAPNLQSPGHITSEDSSHSTTSEQRMPENEHGCTVVNPPGGIVATVRSFIGRTLHIPDAPVRRTPPRPTRPKLPFPSSDVDSDSNSSSSDGNSH
jgi:hypothetical protein